MTLSASEKADLARYRLEKARALLSDSEALLQRGSFASSANRSYYAAFTAARGLLAVRGADASTHDGVKVLLARDFVRTGLLPAEASETLRSLQGRRADADYGDYVQIGEAEASDSFEKAGRFLEQAAAALEKLLK